MKEWLTPSIFNSLHHLIRTSKTFFRGNASLQVVLFTFFEPNLQFFIMFSQEMRANFMIKHSFHATFAILTRQFYIHFTFTSFWIVSYTSRSNLIFLKVDKNPFFNSKSLNIILNLLMSFFLIKFPAFSFVISRLTAILFQK